PRPPTPPARALAEGRAQRRHGNPGESGPVMGATQAFSAKVTSLRQVDWESLRPNLLFIFPSGSLDGQPQRGLPSVRWESAHGLFPELRRALPS
ncbi:ABC transporter permease, partial [Salmonella enterica subsp. enterica serovar Wilhelmsburg]